MASLKNKEEDLLYFPFNMYIIYSYKILTFFQSFFQSFVSKQYFQSNAIGGKKKAEQNQLSRGVL